MGKIFNGVSEKVIIVYKDLGATPLECLNMLKISRPELANTPLTYAGRLDPMAEGLMIVLVGEECKNKDAYLGFNKTYEFEILIGFETDTYDLLGLLTSLERVQFSNEGLRMVWPSFQENLARRSEDLSNSLFENGKMDLVFKSFVGTFIQKYPSFSSKTVGGKQLFQLSKDDELPQEMPEHEVTIYDLKQTGIRTISKEELQTEIFHRVALVRGDFRQEEIQQKWQSVFAELKHNEFQIISCIMKCSSGTYVRQLVNDISKKVGVPMVTYSIKRTKIGEYALNDNVNI